MRLLIAIAFALGASARRASSQRHRALSDASLRDDSLCPEGEKPSPKAKVRWLRETSDNANRSYDIGIPKPYGGLAPFKPSEMGATMRHIRRPQPRDIEL